MGRNGSNDPLSIFMTPPPGETPEQKALREAREAEARRVSDRIDEGIKADRAAMKKDKYLVRVLLLGQAESGKSTTLKNFRMKYARAAWKAERASWRAVIQLNLIRSVLTILDVVQTEMTGSSRRFRRQQLQQPLLYENGNGAHQMLSEEDERPMSGGLANGTGKGKGKARDNQGSNVGGSGNGNMFPSASSASVFETASILTTSTSSSMRIVFNDKHQVLCRRLAVLKRVERELKRRLGAGTDEVEFSERNTAGVLGEEEEEAEDDTVGDGEQRDGVSTPMLITNNGSAPAQQSVAPSGQRYQDVVVRCWKDALFPRAESPAKGDGKRPASSNGANGSSGMTDEPTDEIASSKDDIRALWEDETVKVVLAKWGVELRDSAGFFLDDLDRIASYDYEPSDDDVLRARLRTLGVQEYRIQFESGGDKDKDIINGEEDPKAQKSRKRKGEAGRDWLVYDVGGARTCRRAWLPYFSDVNAIIFLAPISCFNERLTEDPGVNRLEDSFLLWRAVCSSKLLAKCTMIIFLNKCDLLKKKLRAGVLVKNYLPSYGDRANELDAVVKYLREKFKAELKEHSPEPRTCYLYPTSVTDIKTTTATLKSVRDGILREHLKHAVLV